MKQPLTLAEDMYVALPGASVQDLRSLIQEAANLGLERICCVLAHEASGQASTWPARVREAAAWAPIEVYSGFEMRVELASQAGSELSDRRLARAAPDFLLVSASWTSAASGLDDAAQSSASEPGTWLAQTLLALIRTMRRHRNVILAELPSELGQPGSPEEEIVDLLIMTAEETGAALLVNERSRCPSAELVQRFYSAQIPIFFGQARPWSTQRTVSYQYGAQVLRALSL